MTAAPGGVVGRGGARTLDTWLETHATHQPDKTALIAGETRWTYGDLCQAVEAMAGALNQRHGVIRGDRMAYLGANSADEVALFFAAARLGAVVVPLNWRLSVDELAFIVGNAAPRLLIHGTESASAAAQVARRTGTPLVCGPELLKPGDDPPPPPRQAALSDPFLIVYTSGTTGRPKGAVLTQEAVLWNALISLHAHDLTAEDHTLNVLPLFHVGGINIQMMPSFFVGATVTLSAGFDPGAVIDALARSGITTTVCVPTMMRALMAHPAWEGATFPTMRMLNTGSTDVPVDILQAVNDRGIPMVQVYGATETGPIATYQRAAEAAATVGSIGRPGAHVDVRIVDPEGRDCPPDTPGEIWVRGPNMFSQYWDDADATEAALSDGWFRTGDVGRRDAGGLLWFVGRLKHVIISGGENIYPAELERILETLPGLTEAAVVGRPDARWGEVPVVVAVSTAGGPDARGVLAAFDDQIARFKWPKDVVFLDALPRNALGKVEVDTLRAIAARVSENGAASK